MFDALENIARRPALFETTTTAALWTTPHRAERMLAFHLDPELDVSSRNHAFIDAACAWMIRRFGLREGRSVCDLGCGPGLYAARLAASGAAVTGVDFSETAIRHARAQAAPNLRYVHADYLAWSPEAPCDLVTLIMYDICALSPAQRRPLLRRIRDALADDGALLLDVYSLAAFAEREEAAICERNQLGGFWFAEDYHAFVHSFRYEAERVALDKYTLFPRSGGCETVLNWLQCFSPETLTEELSAAGLAVDVLLGDVAGAAFDEDAPEFAVVARKA